MSLKKIIKNIFAPDSVAENNAGRQRPANISPDKITVNEILNLLMEHFRGTIETLSTDFNFLFHTSFTIYLKASNYQDISQGFPFLAEAAEKMLCEEIRANIKSRHLKNYKPHSIYWQFQLVELPPEAMIGETALDGEDDSALVQISSTLFPPTDDKPEPQNGSGRIVTTVHGVNTLRQIRNCINPEILNRIYLYEKDRIKLNLRLDDIEFQQATDNQAGTSKKSERLATAGAAKNTTAGNSTPYSATLVAEDGNFIDGNNRIHTVAVVKDDLHITGRSAMPGPDSVQVVRADSDKVLTPHFRLRRDAASGRFSYSVLGETRVNQRTIAPDPNTWHPLPNNSTIILADEIQIKFKLK